MSAKGRVGISASDGKAKKDMFDDSHSYGDSMLELVSFEGLLGIISGRAKRIAQEEGKIGFLFKDTPRDLYMNIDGEYFLVKRPKRAVVS